MIDMKAVEKNAAAVAALKLAMGAAKSAARCAPRLPLPRLDPSPDDDRDYPFVASGKRIPRKTDLRPMMTAVEDQSALGSCTGQTAVGGCEYFKKRAGDFIPGESDLSPLAVYKMARDHDGIKGDEGAYLRTALRVSRKLGIPSEKTVPYLIANYDAPLTEQAKAEALTQRLTEFQSINPKSKGVHRQIKAALADGFPVATAGYVFESLRHMTGPFFEHKAIRNNPAYAQMIGAHAMVIVGHIDALGIYIVRNSWGAAWGDQGYYGMPQKDLGYVFEIWPILGFGSAV